jgi:hypothetical protein
MVSSVVGPKFQSGPTGVGCSGLHRDSVEELDPITVRHRDGPYVAVDL